LTQFAFLHQLKHFAPLVSLDARNSWVWH
jgi:hypothetical protein